MGELLAFKALPRVARDVPARAEAAEILFFTGVRYMRPEDYVEDRKALNHRPEGKRLPARDKLPN